MESREKALFVENGEDEDEDGDVFEVDNEPIFDTNAAEQETVTGDGRENFIVRRSCMTLKAIEND